MRRTLPLLALLAAMPALAAPTEDWSGRIARDGLAPTEAALSALPSPTPDDLFALAGVRFLREVERAFQVRWQTGLSDPTGMLPFLRLPVPENPLPAPAGPETLANLFREIATGLEGARAPLDAIPPGADLGVEIDLADLWFDIDANGARQDGEGLMDILGPMILGWRWMERDPATPAPVIRFDASDAPWLSAYTHLLGGMVDTVLGYDPTAAIAEIGKANADMSALSPLPPDEYGFNASFGQGIDMFATIIAALDQEPDAERLKSAQAHFLAMVADNRKFWAAVATETDNDREWLPNDRQQSALGIEVPPGTGEAWLAVLADGEAILKGEKLVPYWRVGPAAGLNVGRMFTEPRPVDLAAWIQGAGAVPYLEKGTRVSGESWMRFENMMLGDAMLFALFLN